MRTRTTAAIILLAGTPALAHRLDEYLQATLISVAQDRVEAQIRLTPGVAVLPVVLASLDIDTDGIVSASKQRLYAERVLHDLSLTVDGVSLPLQLVSARFPTVEEMKDGMGEIQIALAADVPRGWGNRRLVFENHHQRRIAAYLVNALVPRDPDIRISGQRRNYDQSFYQLDYVQRGGVGRWLSGSGLLGAAALLLVARIALNRRRQAQAQRASEV